MYDGGLNSYRLPVVPRASRSSRGRGPMTKRLMKNQYDEEDEEKSRGFDFLETMEVEVEHEVSFSGKDRALSDSLSKDWLALGPSNPNSPLIGYRDEAPSSSEEDDFREESRSWRNICGSKMEGKRKMYHRKERSGGRQPESIYPFKKRKLFSQNHQSESRDSQSNVKFCIKSFKIPELSVDIPISSTIGSLKKRVMEAVMKILKDGLKVGVLLGEKSIGDDSKTLIQTGLRRQANHGAVGFSLEPRKPDGLSPAPENRLCVSRRVENTTTAISVVPVQFSRSETSQRRIRRPFTVSEVELLVQAVERLGTGRWRDVKSHAFDHSHHRTYVDLKDKWKTLVHTAKISPRQRRGEPVPQELLNRVLTAHAFWSDRQSDSRCKSSS